MKINGKRGRQWPALKKILQTFYVCLLLASLCLSSHRLKLHFSVKYTNYPFGAAAFFGLVACVVYGIDAVVKFLGWRRGQVAQGRVLGRSRSRPTIEC